MTRLRCASCWDCPSEWRPTPGRRHEGDGVTAAGDADPRGLRPVDQAAAPDAAPPDPLFGSSGRVLGRSAYDLGTAAPPLPPDAAGRTVQRLDCAETVEHVIETTIGVFGRRKFLLRGVRTVLGWLAEFDGDTWEDRWLASGADHAPRSWREAVRPGRLTADVAVAANALMVARVLRPSYGWQLAAHAGTQLPERMLTVNDDDDALRRLRALPAFREHCYGIRSTPRRACPGW